MLYRKLIVLHEIFDVPHKLDKIISWSNHIPSVPPYYRVQKRWYTSGFFSNIITAPVKNRRKSPFPRINVVLLWLQSVKHFTFLLRINTDRGAEGLKYAFNSQLNPEGVFLVARSVSKHFVPIVAVTYDPLYIVQPALSILGTFRC